MLGAETWRLDSAIDSLVLWWREAGLHTLTTDQPADWYAAHEPVIQRTAAPVAASSAATYSSPGTTARPGTVTPLPGDLPSFLRWLAKDETQPDARWDGPALLPPATIDAPLMIVIDVPASANGEVVPPVATAMLGAMLASIGLSSTPPASTLPLATLAIRHPAGGLADDDTLKLLGDRFLHYLGLARPRALLILGERTARALRIANRVAGQELSSVNHFAGIVPAAIIAHPALLMRRPRAKAESWKSLRHLTGVLP